jgi:glycosyltransferase involved in cell wall biosynthesis
MAAGGNFIWLAAGRLSPAKDYPTLLRAFAQLRASNPSARLWVAGQGTKATLEALEAAAASLNLTEQVSWLGLRRDLPALLDAADAFVLSSAWEGMPLVVAEAMAMKKAVVATDVGGVRELVGEAGAIVPPHNPEFLAEAMQSVMHQPAELRRAQGFAARLRIQQHFNLDSRADEWEALYLDLLKRAR